MAAVDQVEIDRQADVFIILLLYRKEQQNEFCVKSV